jgi:hypothetical protein
MIGLSLSPTSALATTRWVAAWGVNNQTCFLATPCASVQHAVVIGDAGDTVFVGKGVFVEPFGVTIDKNLTVEGADSLLTRVDGETTEFSVFQIEAGVTVTIRRLQVRHGRAVLGGGIHNFGDLTLERVRVAQNQAVFGGGIYNHLGAAIRMRECEVSYNSLAEPPGFSFGSGGGGIFNDGFATLDQVKVVANHVTKPNRIGGIAQHDGLLIVHRSLIAVNQGYGIGNSAPLYMVNSTVSRNQEAGLSSVVEGAAILVHVTVAENGLSGDSFSAGAIVEAGASLILRNTIVAKNAKMQCSIAGDISGTASLTSDDTCNLSPFDNLTSADPMLGQLTNNGGPTQTHALKAGSPAIDHATSEFCEAVDQRGVNRPVDGDFDNEALCDIGAFEFVPHTPR